MGVFFCPHPMYFPLSALQVNEAMRLQCRALFHNFDAILVVQYIGGTGVKQ